MLLNSLFNCKKAEKETNTPNLNLKMQVQTALSNGGSWNWHWSSALVSFSGTEWRKGYHHRIIQIEGLLILYIVLAIDWSDFIIELRFKCHYSIIFHNYFLWRLIRIALMLSWTRCRKITTLRLSVMGSTSSAN